MVDAGSSRQVTQPVKGLMATLMVMAWPDVSLAQLPTVAETTIVQQNNSRIGSVLAYKLGGGDRIRVDILEVPDFSGEYEVLADGSLNLPLIGTISVGGLTLTQATDLITLRYRRFLKEPVISLNVIALRPLRVGVVGEVTRPGSYNIPLIPGVGLRPGTQYPTVTQAIERAGGVTQAADPSRVQLRRSGRNGAVQVINIDLLRLLQQGDTSQDVVLQDGDGIFVPTATTVNLERSRQLATTSLGTPIDQPRTVGVVGEVNRPGAYVLFGGTTRSDLRPGGLPTVTAALQLAGGITSSADIRNIEVRRPTQGAGEQIITVNLWQLLQAGDFNQDIIVQEGDTIFIPTATDINPAEAGQIATAGFSPATINVYVAGEVRQPGQVQVPPNTPLNQALLAKGGFGFENSRARRGAVELVRLNSNGTVSRRTIALDFTQSANEQTNPILRNNDTIIVNRSGLTRFADEVRPVLEPVQTLENLFNIFDIFRLFF